MIALKIKLHYSDYSLTLVFMIFTYALNDINLIIRILPSRFLHFRDMLFCNKVLVFSTFLSWKEFTNFCNS